MEQGKKACNLQGIVFVDYLNGYLDYSDIGHMSEAKGNQFLYLGEIVR